VNNKHALPDSQKERTIIKIRSDENFIIWFLYKLTFPMAHLLSKIHVSPNLITTSGLFLVGFAGYLTINDYGYLYIAAAWYSALLLDLIDGQVARISNKVRKHSFGYDHTSDLVKISILLISIGLKYSSKTLWPVIAICLVAIQISDKLNYEISINPVKFTLHPKINIERIRSKFITNTYTILLTYNTHTLLVFPFLLQNQNLTLYFLFYLIGISSINGSRFIYILIKLPRIS